MGQGGAVTALALEGVTVSVDVLGCRSNLCDCDALASELAARGAVVGHRLAGARAALIVTCSVTAEADRKSRAFVRRARRALGEEGLVAACGCWAQRLGAEEARELGVDIVAGTRGRARIPDAIETMLRDGRSFLDLRRGLDQDEGWDEMPCRPAFHTKAFMKVQEGCAHRCSYCLIPSVRGRRPISRPLASVLDEARRLAEGGCKEIVLTGTDLGAWGRDLGTGLDALVRALGEVEGLERLRLGSIEPFSLTEGLLGALAESSIFCPHLHLPMQSGNDRVLALMRRGHDAEAFARVCEEARAALGPDLHISTDVMTGFPGEDDAAFEETLALMRRCSLGRAHVFPFSARPGTPAMGLPDQVSSKERDARAKRAIALGGELLRAYAARSVGRVLPVLVEGARGRAARGHVPCYLEVAWDADGARPSEIVPVEIVSVTEGGSLVGRVS